MGSLAAYTPYILAGIGVIIGVIGYFLKKNFNRVDEHDRQIADIKENYAKKEDLKEVRDSGQEEMAKWQHRIDERFDKIEAELKAMNKEYVTTDAFIREIKGLDGKLQRIIDLMLRKGG